MLIAGDRLTSGMKASVGISEVSMANGREGLHATLRLGI